MARRSWRMTAAWRSVIPDLVAHGVEAPSLHAGDPADSPEGMGTVSADAER